MKLAEKASHLPDAPGVYLFKDAKGTVIYVGKAVSLRNRVRSYFGSAQNNKVQAMLARAADLSFIVTGSEVEALILEANLIKEHRPHFNIVLKDDKSYPFLRVTVNEEFPRVFVTRRQVRDGSRYFGPYPSASAVHETLKLIKRLFPFRSCTQARFRNARPCLNYHIKRCLAPCAGLADPEQYAGIIRDVCLFLEGKHDELIRELNRKMSEAAADLDFEKAAEYRDQLRAIDQVLARQNIVSTKPEDQDVVALARDGDRGEVLVLEIRNGKLLRQEQITVRGVRDRSDAEVLAAFLKQYYMEASFVPPEILLAHDLGDERQVIAEWLTARRGGKVQVRVPRRGRKKELVDMALKNAALVQEQMRLERGGDRAVAELAEVLGLPEPPARLEAFDISNIQGHQTVGSMVVFENGKPNPAAYRRFKVRSVEGPNDFAAMGEVVGRRFARAVDEQQLVNTGQMKSREAKFLPLPSLVLIDGGKGQLNAAVEVMRSLGFGHIPVYGLAKEEEELFTPGNPDPLPVPKDSRAQYILQHLRDEAHRFAVTYHRRERTKQGLRSFLDEVEGIGPARRRALLKAFPSLEAIKQAGVDELAAVPGMNRKVAEAVYRFFLRDE
ncbi:excinuclease ABC subunit UvrC [Desulforudis sp. DRI-14]|uniref:excinuclease ABC subunit UvrC n=1 Tax=Desulforudis sp. DRI-14 TaxID=3459793 RepID=UPI00404184E1